MSETEAEAAPAKRAAIPVKSTTLNYETHAVEIENVAYPFGQLPEKVQKHFALAGYAYHLARKADVAAAHAEAVAGKVRALSPARVEALNPWMEAAANIRAEYIVKQAGVKLAPGKSIRATPEFAAEKASLIAAAGKWSRTQVAEAKKHAAIVAEHNKLTGVSTDASALFAPAPADAAEAAAA